MPRRAENVPAPGVFGFAQVTFYSNPTCRGTTLGLVKSGQAVALPSGRFLAVRGNAVAPEGATAALLQLIRQIPDIEPYESGEPVLFDDAFMQQSGACAPDPHTLCFADGKLRASAFVYDANNSPSLASVVQLSPTSGYFYTYSADDAELTMKAFDFGGSGKWVVVGGMTNLRLEIDVQDLSTGETKKFTNESGHFLSPIVDRFRGE